MRIKDNGRYEWRKEQYTEAADAFGEATKSKGIDASTGFAIEMLSNLERAMDHPDMTADLVEILSTRKVQLDYWIETDIYINGDGDADE